MNLENTRGRAGCLAGYVYSGTIENCKIDMPISQTGWNTCGYIGGVIGSIEEKGSIEYCIHKGNIDYTQSGPQGSNRTNPSIGGIAGSSGADISFCENYSIINISLPKRISEGGTIGGGGVNVGGIVGYVYYKKGTYNYCKSIANFNVTDETLDAFYNFPLEFGYRIGGIVGSTQDSKSVVNCYSSVLD